MHVKKSSLQQTVVLLILAAFAAAGLCFFIPVAPTVVDPLMAHIRTSFAAVLGVLFIGSAVWFFAGLKGFKAQLRTACVFLGAGLIIFSMAMLQLPLFGLFDLWHTAWATGGGVILIFLFGAFLMYLAILQFARTLKFKNLVSSAFIVSAVTILLTALGFAAGKYLVQYQLDGVDIYVAAVATTMSFFFFSGYVALKIVGIIGPAYKQFMMWLGIFFLVLLLGAAHEGITTLFLTTGSPYEDYGVYLWPFVAAGFVILRASYEFRLLTSIPIPDVSAITAGQEVTDRDYIDSILGLANLVSRPKDVDTILDDLRFVTAKLTPNTKLAFGDKERLLKVYYQLESYLLKDDALRKFDQTEVRRHITPRFRVLLGGEFNRQA